MFDRAYLDLFRRIAAAPDVHLGCSSLTLLETFHIGYCFFRPDVPSDDVSLLSVLRLAVSKRYGFEGGGPSVFEMVRRVSENEERAFELFIRELDLTMLQHPEAVRRSPARFLYRESPPVSVILDVLEKPRMLLPRQSVGCLRALIEGISLAALDSGHDDCLDLEGFPLWVRRQFNLKGMFRWEKAVLDQLCGDEVAAFRWATEEMRAYRASKGPTKTFDLAVVDRAEAGDGGDISGFS
jgi:hypothetical protein